MNQKCDGSVYSIIVEKDVYLYSNLDGEFKVYKGCIVNYTKYICKGYVFYDNDTKKPFACSRYECSPFNGNLWLRKRNDNQAKNAFIKHYQEEISKYTKKIDMWNYKIKLLNKEETT